MTKDDVIMFKKIIKKVFFLALAFILMVVFHRFSVNKFNITDKTSELKESLPAAYKAYSFSSFEVEKDKLLQYADALFQKDVAAGKTDKEFKGFTIVEYSWKALDEHQEEINVKESLALFLPLILAVLVIVALIVSIRLGLSAIRKLDFDNEATSF